MTRREARDNGFKIIFEYEFQKESADNLLELFYELNPHYEKQKDYLNTIVHGVLENLSDIDEKIEKYANGWKINRISKVSLAALRLGIYEVLYSSEVDDNIAINEAVELTKIYEGDKAKSFVNGVLASVYKEKQA